MAIITQLVGRLIFFRHGQTAYTNQEFDLTPEGVETIQNTAETLKQRLEGVNPIRIVHSPKPRAKSSALILEAEMGDMISDIAEDRHISSAGIKNYEKAMALFQELGTVAAIDLNYDRDCRFDDPEVFEPRNLVRARFYWYLGRIIRKLAREGQDIWNADLDFEPCYIFISHYELLCHFVKDIFNLDYSRDETLKHGEIIHVLVYQNRKTNSLELMISFRDRYQIVSYELSFES